MHSKGILIASLTYFSSLVIFERDGFILDQCELGGTTVLWIYFFDLICSYKASTTVYGFHGDFKGASLTSLKT